MEPEEDALEAANKKLEEMANRELEMQSKQSHADAPVETFEQADASLDSPEEEPVKKIT